VPLPASRKGTKPRAFHDVGLSGARIWVHAVPGGFIGIADHGLFGLAAALVARSLVLFDEVSPLGEQVGHNGLAVLGSANWHGCNAFHRIVIVEHREAVHPVAFVVHPARDQTLLVEPRLYFGGDGEALGSGQLIVAPTAALSPHFFRAPLALFSLHYALPP
jgi:hypothetical protein